MSGKEGVLGGSTKTIEQSVASMADWYTARALNISGAAGDVVVATAYPGLVCKGIREIGDASGNIIVKFWDAGSAGSSITIPVAAKEYIGKLPAIHTIVKSGTKDSLLLFFQKK